MRATGYDHEEVAGPVKVRDPNPCLTRMQYQVPDRQRGGHGAAPVAPGRHGREIPGGAAPSAEQRTGKTRTDHMNIYAGNLSYSVTDEDLREIFGAFGEVSKASVISDRDSGRSKGFGFVEMPVDEEARQAIDSLNGKDVKGRNINVNEARPRPERSDRPRRY